MFSAERREEILRTFIENAPKLSQGGGPAAHPAGLAALPLGRKRQADTEVLDFSVSAKMAHVSPHGAPHTNGQLTRFDEDKLHASKPRVSPHVLLVKSGWSRQSAPGVLSRRQSSSVSVYRPDSRDFP